MTEAQERKNDIVIFCASEEFSRIAAEVIQNRGLENHISIVNATGEETIRKGEELIRTGSRVFISRGRNTLLLQKNMTVPVIDVPFLYEEILSSVRQAGCAPEDIILVGFDKAYESMTRFRRLSGLNVQIVNPKSPATAKQELQAVIRPNTKVLIGGFSVKEVASATNLRRIPLSPDPDNISLAIDSALNILVTTEKQDALFKTISASVDRIPHSVFSCDPQGKLQFANEKAASLFRIYSQERIFRLLFSEEEEPYYFSLLQKKLTQEEEASLKKERIIHLNEQAYVVEYLPVIVNHRAKNVVIIISSDNVIQSAEKQLRLSQNSRGYIAKNQFRNIIGNSKALQDTIRLAKKYALSDGAVHITGETGTGKEMFAQSIHNASPRASEPFVAINCAAISQSLLESELFGYVKGAFTGAKKEGKMGIFEMAHKGTVFLDEIGELDLSIQAKLLRVLQEKEVCRLGDDKIIPVDIRIISATNRNLQEMVEKKQFREDLLYRLNVLELTLPPLRERKEDIPALVCSYLELHGYTITFSKEAMDMLCAADYPGNIRHLFNMIERILALTETDWILPKDLAGILPKTDSPKQNIEKEASDEPVLLTESVADCEKERIEETLKRHHGSRALTAKELKISTATLWRKMKKYELL
ncbi:MAG: sigma 54-interacting transcriptional regulator [Clostridiaceae bacterium]|nr:sigma 54-interacting transcriptional regulator [Clostridiaceae bacterium]